MAFIGRLLVALLFVLPALPFHALIPVLKVLQFTNEDLFLILGGADPLITAYVDAGFIPAGLLFISTICLLGSLFGTLMGERWAAGLVILAAFSDAASLHFANTMGYTELGLSALQIAGLGGLMVVIYLFVRWVTKEV